MKSKLAYLYVFLSAASIFLTGDILNEIDPARQNSSYFQKNDVAIERAILEELEENGGPAISVSVYHKGNFVFDKAFGFADFGRKRKARPSTLFKAGSATKSLVALAILRLQEQGKVTLEAPIGNYISGLNRQIGALTLKQLLSHTAGLKDQTSDFGPSGKSRQIEFAKGLSQSLFFTEPGEVFSYSNPGYNLAGAVIEAVTEMDFNSAMKQLVLEPLGMNTSTYRHEEVAEEDLAYGHSGSVRNFHTGRRLPDNARERASGMMMCTAQELNRFLVWLNQPSEETIKETLREVIADKRATGTYFEYSLGLFQSNYCGNPSIWHTGGMPGYTSTMVSIPEEDFSIVVLVNGRTANRNKIIYAAIESLLGSDCYKKREPLELTDFSSSEIQSMTGRYFQGIGRSFELTNENNQLILSLGGQRYECKKDKEGHLITLSDGRPMASYGVFRDESGKVKHLQYWVRAYPKIR